MKKLMYLLVAGTMFAFTACNCGAGDAEATDSEVVAEDVVVEEVTAEAVGCQVEGGTCLADHSCCAAHEEVTEETHDHGTEGHSHE